MNFLKALCCLPDNKETKKIINSQVKRSLNRNSTFNLQRNKIAIENEGKDTFYQPKDQFRCLFCGGNSCKHENFKNHTNPAIIGLHSDLIDDCIFASQRPSTVLINEYKLIEQFKRLNISLIVNVQREGEHPFCGPNKELEKSGFTYDPESFIREGIDVIHSGWKDMSVPDSPSFVLKLVKEMYDTIKIKNEKVLVHCHAGYGRTGIIIACFLIYSYEIKCEDAVNILRSYRKKCIEKKEQYNYCELFEGCKSNKNTIFLLLLYFLIYIYLQYI